MAIADMVKMHNHGDYRYGKGARYTYGNCLSWIERILSAKAWFRISGKLTNWLAIVNRL